MRKVGCITINTDASFNPEYKIGGYAFHIVSDLWRIKFAKAFMGEQPKTSQQAEIMCIGNAIAYLLKYEHLPKSHWLVINTDCWSAIDEITKQSTPIGKEVNKLWGRLISRLGSKKNKIRHVKAHSGKEDSRSFVNEWCDREAKKCMREAVNKMIENAKQDVHG